MNNINARLQGVVSRGVKEAEIDENGHLIFTLTDNSVTDLGKVDGKSAYESAHDGGYTGTEAQFNSDLAKVSEKKARVFTLSGTTDYENAQAACDFAVSGQFPIICYNGKFYLFSSARSSSGINSTFRFYDAGSIHISDSSNKDYLYYDGALEIYEQNGIVTQIRQDLNRFKTFLDTDKDYQATYSPRYPGSPATKKYVDDSVSTALQGKMDVISPPQADGSYVLKATVSNGAITYSWETA